MINSISSYVRTQLKVTLTIILKLLIAQVLTLLCLRDTIKTTKLTALSLGDACEPYKYMQDFHGHFNNLALKAQYSFDFVNAAPPRPLTLCTDEK